MRPFSSSSPIPVFDRGIMGTASRSETERAFDSCSKRQPRIRANCGTTRNATCDARHLLEVAIVSVSSSLIVDDLLNRGCTDEGAHMILDGLSSRLPIKGSGSNSSQSGILQSRAARMRPFPLVFVSWTGAA